MPAPSSRLDHIISRGLPVAVLAVRAARRRVELLARRHPTSSPAELLSLARRELARAEPDIARAITNAVIAAWVTAARQPARDAAPLPLDPDRTREVVEAIVGATPSLIPPPHGVEDASPFRFPAIEVAARDLLTRDVVTTSQLQQLASDAHSAASAVASSVSSAGIGAVRAALAETVHKGSTLRDFRKAVGPMLDAAGFSDSQVETTYRTQVGQAQAAGLKAVLEHPLVGDEFPFILYSFTGDQRTREEHRYLGTHGLDGTGVYWRDDPTIIRFFPPCAWNCRCVAIPLSAEDAANYGVRDARRWLSTGEEPTPHTWVKPPPFGLPKNWPEADGRVRSVV